MIDDAELKMPDVLSRSFTYTVIFDKIDQDLFDKYTRADDARSFAVRIAREVYLRSNPNFDPEQTVDHINRNPFDNRRSNLRQATRSEQVANRRTNRNNTSGHRGVRKKRNKWQARTVCGGIERSKSFEYSDDGLKSACAYYRNVLLKDGSQCLTCHPDAETDDSLHIDLSQYLHKNFNYTILFSPEDEEIFNKWTRADDARNACLFTRKVWIQWKTIIPEGLSIDHININAFDNRRENLRLATRSEQQKNKRKIRGSASEHKHVIKMGKNGQEQWVGSFNLEETVKRKHFPFTPQGERDACEWVRLNKPDSHPCEICQTSNDQEQPSIKKQRVE